MWPSADLAILVPVLRRPWRVEPLLASIRQATPDAHVLFLCSTDDDAQIDAVEAAGAAWDSIDWAQGDYARKVNLGAQVTTEPLLFLAADDLHFHPGWFEVACEHLDDGIGVVGTNDLCNRRTRWGHSTHSLVTRDYVKLGTIDEPGKVLHEGYPHEFVDDELVGTAKHRRAYAHATRARVEHLHPMVGKAPMDELYQAQAARMRAGRALYERRRALWT